MAGNELASNALQPEVRVVHAANSPLSLATLQKAVDELTPLIRDGTCNICEITGGEPTIHPHFVDITKYLAALKDRQLIYKLVLLTNGDRLSDMAQAKTLAADIDDVVITIYTSDPEQHDMVTGVKDSLYRKLEAISNLISLGVKVHVKTLVMKPSFKLIPGIAELVCSNFKENIHFTINTVHFIGDAKTNSGELGVRIYDAAPYIEEAIDIAKILRFLRWLVCSHVLNRPCLLEIYVYRLYGSSKENICYNP